jgi:Holliday junction resolvase-like predicted endonuclease
MKLVKIVAHHKFPEDAARVMLKENVIAVGWPIGNIKNKNKEWIRRQLEKNGYSKSEIGHPTSTLIKFRDAIHAHDIVFLYMGHNKIALVGEVEGKYKFNDKNEVGNAKGKIKYPHQRLVKWWDSPRNFHRELLPDDLKDKIASRGTLNIFYYDIKKLKNRLSKIPSEDIEEKVYEIKNEAEIKKDLKKYLHELGLEDIKQEFELPGGPIDFFAKDRNGIPVLIEVKITADEDSVGQLLRYIGAYKKDKKTTNVKGIIIAKEFTQRCKMAVSGANQNIELYKYEIKPSLIKIS